MCRTFSARWAFALLAVAAATAAEPARGQESPPAIAQYVEQVPTSSGGASAGVAVERVTPLAPSIRHALGRRGGRDAERLEKLATSSRYGAPQRRAPRTIPPPAQPRGLSVGAVATATADADKKHLIGLAAVLALITLGTISAALARYTHTRGA